MHPALRDGCLGDRHVDAQLVGQSKIRSYRELIETALGENLTPRLFHQYHHDNKDAHVVLIRHDVDHSLDNAMIVAEIEYNMGIKSTYFMLHPGDYNTAENYYGSVQGNRIVHAPGFFDRCRELQAMGHEIGLHTDFAQLSFLTGRGVRDLLVEEIAAFADAGITIRGSASHGSEFARQQGMTNYEIFAECVSGSQAKGRAVSRDGWQIALHSIPLAEVGLEYEAYFVPRNMDFSDTGSQLGLYSQKERVSPANVQSDDDVQHIRRMIRDQPDPRLVILAHPCWWTKCDGPRAGN
jgi:hypothetical protein